MKNLDIEYAISTEAIFEEGDRIKKMLAQDARDKAEQMGGKVVKMEYAYGPKLVLIRLRAKVDINPEIGGVNDDR